MPKRILTMFWYDDVGEVHLYKDVGGIPYALAKYCGWQATFAYNDANGIIHNEDYEKYVKLDRIRFPKILEKLKLRYIKYFQVIKYVYFNAPKYDVINFYHCHKFIKFLCWIAKKRNPDIITYVKLDMSKTGFEKEIKKNSKFIWKYTDLFTVETNKYVENLNKLSKFFNKVKYLPNGFFSDLADIDLSKVKKEKIILTVGRLGTYQKNTELLIETLIESENDLEDWQVYLVGPMTENFKIWLNNKLADHSKLKNKIVITGNIIDKKELYQIYGKSSIFVLPSRYESWGLVLSEAMYFANYPIVTNCCDAFNEMLCNKKEKYGLIVESENVEALKSAIIYGISHINDNFNSTKIGSDFINKNFNWKIIAHRLENYFDDILSKNF